MLGIDTPGMHLVQALNRFSRNEIVCPQKMHKNEKNFKVFIADLLLHAPEAICSVWPVLQVLTCRSDKTMVS